MTDLYETPDIAGEIATIECDLQETIEEITARLIRDRDKRIAELERELGAMAYDFRDYLETIADPCRFCLFENADVDCEACCRCGFENESHWTHRGPVAGENVEV